MTIRRAVHFLEELDGDLVMPADYAGGLEFDSLFVSRPSQEAAGEPEAPEFIEAAGYDRGFAEAQAKTIECYEALLREREAAFEERLAAERQRWAETTAAESARLIKDEIYRCECAIGNEVARLLLPLIGEQLTQRSINEIRDLVRRLLTESPEAHLRISGPRDLVEAMREALGENGLHASVQESDTLELRVEIDQVVVESRVSKWIERLQEAAK